MNCLLIEDDLGLGRVLQKIVSETYRADWVRLLSDADRMLHERSYDIVLLDLGLPDGDGLHWLRRLRQDNTLIPVLILTARDHLDSRVQGLDTGADDYLIKPFASEELLARMRVLLRRVTGHGTPLISCGDLAYDPALGQFSLNGQALNLTTMERELLSGLILARGRPVHRDQLLQRLYGTSHATDSNTLEVLVHTLRKRIGPGRIETLRGYGYCLQENA